MERNVDNWLFDGSIASVRPALKTKQFQQVNKQAATAGEDWFPEAGIEILRATRSWIQYGTVGFAIVCIVVGAVEALFGR